MKLARVATRPETRRRGAGAGLSAPHRPVGLEPARAGELGADCLDGAMTAAAFAIIEIVFSQLIEEPLQHQVQFNCGAGRRLCA